MTVLTKILIWIFNECLLDSDEQEQLMKCCKQSGKDTNWAAGEMNKQLVKKQHNNWSWIALDLDVLSGFWIFAALLWKI